jgi:hypothetical protein
MDNIQKDAIIVLIHHHHKLLDVVFVWDVTVFECRVYGSLWYTVNTLS